MSENERKEHAIALPGEWALRKAFGPVLDELGEDLKSLYAAGRDSILAAGYRKVADPDDGKKANLRVTRDVFWNGAFTESEICAEYFGGILASSRSEDGADDGGVHYVDTIKSLSSNQLHLHYLIYRSINLDLSAREEALNVGQSNDLNKANIWLSSLELEEGHSVELATSMNILFRKGLISKYQTSHQELEGDRVLPYTMARPTTFGVLLYAAAHNRMSDWRLFSSEDFGPFEGIGDISLYAPSLEKLLEKAGVKKKQADEQP